MVPQGDAGLLPQGGVDNGQLTLCLGFLEGVLHVVDDDGTGRDKAAADIVEQRVELVLLLRAGEHMQELGLVGHGHLADPHEGLLTGAHIDTVEAGREAGGLTDNVGPLESGTGCLTAEDGHELAEGLGTVDGDLQDAGGAAGGDSFLGVVDETVVAGALKTVEGGIAAAEKTGHETVADECQVGGWGDTVGIGGDAAEEGNALGAVERRELADADLTVEHALADEQTAYSAVVLQTAARKEQRRDDLVGEAVGDDVALEHHRTDIIVGERLGTADGHETVGKLTDGLTQGVGVPAGVALAGGDILGCCAGRW